MLDAGQGQQIGIVMQAEQRLLALSLDVNLLNTFVMGQVLSEPFYAGVVFIFYAG